MVTMATSLLFVTSVIALYALILSRKNRIVLLFLIPALLVASVYTGYSIYVLQGTPKAGIPEDTQVEIVWMEVAKPDIRLLLRVEGDTEPTYYRIPYSEENVKELEKAMQQAKALGKEGPDGVFKKNTGGEENGGEFNFIQKPRTLGPQKKTDTSWNNTQSDEFNNLNSVDSEAQRRQELLELGVDAGFATSPIADIVTAP